MTDTTTIGPTSAPRWDLSPLFPALNSSEFDCAFSAVTQQIEALEKLHDSHQVRRREYRGIDADFIAAFETVMAAWNAIQESTRLLSSYLGCLTSTDARDEAAKSRYSQLNMALVKTDKLYSRFVAWTGTSDIEALVKQSAAAREHEYFLRKTQKQARHQMSEPEEELAAELYTSALTGWARLHGNMSALLEAKVALPDGEKSLPMSSVRALAANPDRTVRKAAFEAELKAWESVGVPFAAALNGIKGSQQTVRRRRGWANDVEPTLLTNGINRQTLNAMQQACVESFPDFRRYMAAKAKALGLDHLTWYDLHAPIGKTVKSYDWPQAEAFIQNNFGRYSPRLAEFAARSFREQWIDAEPRVGKQGGAYCTGPLPGISRIMMNYDGSFNSISTLAHELGHAYHNLNLKERTSLQRGTPMTLAETASIFCETLAFEAASAQAGAQEQLALLDTVLERNLMVVVDIHSRFLFEQGVFTKRAERDLTVPELNELMTWAQRETFGSDLEPLHPYMWAVKGHYFGPTFYNYPYTFGLLFGLGLYAQYQVNPDKFQIQYDEFLSSTGMEDAVTLCAAFGLNIEQPDFWKSSLDVIRGQIDEFERLTRVKVLGS